MVKEADGCHQKGPGVYRQSYERVDTGGSTVRDEACGGGGA